MDRGLIVVDKQSGNHYYYNIAFLKVIAVLLIINSHMDSIYPYSSLATGGALGNALFFLASGYLLREKKKNFQFFIKFFAKIYIPLIIATLLFAFDSNQNIISQFIWPTNFWFVGAIVLFYCLYTLLERVMVFKHYNIFLAIMIVLYITTYITVLDTSIWTVEAEGLNDITASFKLIYYFAIMVTGGILKDKSFSNRIISLSRVGWIASILLMYILKLFMIKYSFLMNFQFTSQLFTFSFAICAFINSTDSKIINWTENRNKIKKIVIKISSISLELYLVQFAMIGLTGMINQFPTNLVVVLVMIFAAAFLLNKLTDLIWIQIKTYCNIHKSNEMK